MIDAHRGAFEYDWRARFAVPLAAVGRAMTWGEALRLTEQLAGDPGSRVGAALAGWEHPVSREWLVLVDLIDRFSRVNFKKPPPYPRPWRTEKRRMKPTVSQETVIEALRMAGHVGPIPERK